MSARIGVLYSSWHGHVRTIAEHLQVLARTRGYDSVLINVRGPRRNLVALDACDAAVVVGSIHFGRHSGRLRRAVEHKLAVLSLIPTAFISVSGSAASVQGGDQAEAYAHDFLRASGWQPDQILSIAGAIAYTRYDPITRAMMRFASMIAGRGTDTARDYDYTNWSVLEAFTHGFLDVVERAERRAS
jgi:menaquinone-dependent protoporphyrinogen oxidase